MLGSVWLPIVFCLVMMAVCCGGPLLVGRWRCQRRARHRPQQASSAMLWMAAAWVENPRRGRQWLWCGTGSGDLGWLQGDLVALRSSWRTGRFRYASLCWTPTRVRILSLLHRS